MAQLFHLDSEYCKTVKLVASNRYNNTVTYSVTVLHCTHDAPVSANAAAIYIPSAVIEIPVKSHVAQCGACVWRARQRAAWSSDSGFTESVPCFCICWSIWSFFASCNGGAEKANFPYQCQCPEQYWGEWWERGGVYQWCDSRSHTSSACKSKVSTQIAKPQPRQATNTKQYAAAAGNQNVNGDGLRLACLLPGHRFMDSVFLSCQWHVTATGSRSERGSSSDSRFDSQYSDVSEAECVTNLVSRNIAATWYSVDGATQKQKERAVVMTDQWSLLYYIMFFLVLRWNQYSYCKVSCDFEMIFWCSWNGHGRLQLFLWQRPCVSTWAGGLWRSCTKKGRNKLQ